MCNFINYIFKMLKDGSEYVGWQEGIAKNVVTIQNSVIWTEFGIINHSYTEPFLPLWGETHPHSVHSKYKSWLKIAKSSVLQR
jgi:hypothetical protein